MAVVGNSMTLNAGTTITSGGRTTRIAYETAGLGQFTNNVAGLNIQAADGAALYAAAGIAPAGYTSTAPDAVVFNGVRVNGNLLNEQQPIGQWIHPYQGEVGEPTYTPGNGTQAAVGAVWYKAALPVVPPPPLVVVPPTPIVNVPASASI